MTAILGLRYLDGVLMMADTEEFLGGDSKSDCDKLFRFIFKVEDPPTDAGTVLTGGAGDSHLIAHANNELRRLFKSGISRGTDLLGILNCFAGEFFENSTRGYQGFDYNQVPQFSMLVAVNVRPFTHLFHWQGNSVTPVEGYSHASIGSGIAQTHPMLRDIEFPTTRESMLFMGIRIMFHAKRMVLGVGGKTEVVALQNDGATYSWGPDITAKVEELVVNFEAFLNKSLYLDVSNVAPNVMELEKNIAQNLVNLGKFIKIYRQAYKRILMPTPRRIKKIKSD